MKINENFVQILTFYKIFRITLALLAKLARVRALLVMMWIQKYVGPFYAFDLWLLEKIAMNFDK